MEIGIEARREIGSKIEGDRDSRIKSNKEKSCTEKKKQSYEEIEKRRRIKQEYKNTHCFLLYLIPFPSPAEAR